MAGQSADYCQLLDNKKVVDDKIKAELAGEVIASQPTSRELEILCLVAQGKSNAEIAYTLGLSIQTVKNHLSSCYHKINARGRVDAALWYRDNKTEVKPE